MSTLLVFELLIYLHPHLPSHLCGELPRQDVDVGPQEVESPSDGGDRTLTNLFAQKRGVENVVSPKGVKAQPKLCKKNG